MESPFAHLLELLAKIEDPRRAEGKLYKLPHVMLFSILAMMAGGEFLPWHSFLHRSPSGAAADAFRAFLAPRASLHYDPHRPAGAGRGRG